MICAGDRLLTDLPPEDFEEAAGYIESHGGAIVLCVVDGEFGELLGSNAKRYMLAWRKKHGDLPEVAYVWVQS